MQLKDKAVLVTGAGSGIGRAIACHLVKQGCNLGLIDLNVNGLEITKKECHSLGDSQVECFSADVADEGAVVDLFKQIKGCFSAIHGLINNAGILRDGLLVKVKDGKLIDKLSLEQWKAVIDVNLTGVFLCAREAAVQMIESDANGVIINISSISRVGNYGQTNYGAAKAGVAAMTVGWAKELARYGIRSVAVAPGMIETEMTSAMKPEALSKMTSGIPLRRMGQPAEIAKTVSFILENDYVNGRVIEIDGGMRI